MKIESTIREFDFEKEFKSPNARCPFCKRETGVRMGATKDELWLEAIKCHKCDLHFTIIGRCSEDPGYLDAVMIIHNDKYDFIIDRDRVDFFSHRVKSAPTIHFIPGKEGIWTRPTLYFYICKNLNGTPCYIDSNLHKELTTVKEIKTNAVEG